MKKIKKILLLCLGFGLCLLANFYIVNTVLADNPYGKVLDSTTSDTAVSSAIKGEGEVVSDIGETGLGSTNGGAIFNEQVLKIIGYAIQVFIAIGIFMAFLGGYKIITSNKEESIKEGIRLIVFGIIGIVVMVSARFLASSLVGENGIISEQFSNIGGDTSPNGITFVDNLYKGIIYPFIKIALYLVTGVLFFMLATRVIGFIVSTDDVAKKKSFGIILWCVIGILIVMGSKQIVEAVMGRQERVLNSKAERITGGEAGMGGEILEFGSVPIIAQIINWVMGLTMFAIVVLIIIQGYKIFTKPDDPKVRENLKKSMLYIIIGIVVIGAAYVISNLLVVNNVQIAAT